MVVVVVAVVGDTVVINTFQESHVVRLSCHRTMWGNTKRIEAKREC